MKQVLQNLRNGEITVEDVPTPQLLSNHLLIRTRASLISAGTERQLVEFGKSSLLQKARSQPHRVGQVLEKMKTDGLLPTLEAVFRKLDEPLPLGYCNAGVVMDVGKGVTEFKPGDRVVSNGPHAEVVCVPKNLCAKIPDDVSDDQAVFTVLASIGLQGIRLIQPTLGERFVIYGLGLIGILAVQILRANGCEVLGIDLNPKRLKIAESLGARVVSADGDPELATRTWTGGRGVDGVLIAVSSKKDDIMHKAAQMCRKRGRIVLVGVVDLKLVRDDFYKKELSFQVSCSYGPGRYDQSYEQKGQDYPYEFVRWTEQRNFQTILELMSRKQLLVEDLVTHRFPQLSAAEAYRTITENKDSMGIVFEYPETIERTQTVVIARQEHIATGDPVLGIIGAGNFTKTTILPVLKKLNTKVTFIASRRGISAQQLADKFNIPYATSDYREILNNDTVNAVLIVLRHHLHAECVVEALKAGKHVFVEKPLAISTGEVRDVAKAAREHPECMIMVGFNRRFSPHVLKVKELLEGRVEPMCVHTLVNSGYISPDSWVQDPVEGGGRIAGEACHFIDLMVCLTGSKIKTVSAVMVGGSVANPEDKMSITLGLEDGSIGSINYFSNGTRSYPKEQVQIFSDRRVIEIDNFRQTTGFGFGSFKKFKTGRQDKGHKAELNIFLEKIRAGGEPVIPFDDIYNVSLAALAAVNAARENKTIVISEFDRHLARAQTKPGDRIAPD